MKEFGRFKMADGKIHTLKTATVAGYLSTISIHDWPDGQHSECIISYPPTFDVEADLSRYIERSFKSGNYIRRLDEPTAIVPSVEIVESGVSEVSSVENLS